MRLSNPVLRRLDNVTIRSSNPATLGGIIGKIFFFLILTAIGGYVSLSNPFPEYQLFFIIGAAVISLITTIVGIFAKRAAFFFGSLYAVSQGIVITYISIMYATLYKGIIPLALGITIVIFLLTITLYATGILKVNQRFKSIVKLMFIGSIVISGVVFLSSFFTPSLATLFLGNGVISIGASVFMVILASASMVMDFDTIALSVKNGRDESLEWYAAFGFTISILWLYLRVLELVAKIMKNNE